MFNLALTEGCLAWMWGWRCIRCILKALLFKFQHHLYSVLCSQGDAGKYKNNDHDGVKLRAVKNGLLTSLVKREWRVRELISPIVIFRCFISDSVIPGDSGNGWFCYVELNKSELYPSCNTCFHFPRRHLHMALGEKIPMVCTLNNNE